MTTGGSAHDAAAGEQGWAEGCQRLAAQVAEWLSLGD
jgi:hypothetical protein